MKNIIIISLLCLGLFVACASGQSVVTLDDNAGVLDLVYLSSDSTEVSAFEILLQCDSDVSITDVKGVAPYEVFYGITDENGYILIAGYTTTLPAMGQKTTFAKIYISGSGNIHVIGVDMKDFNRQIIDLDNPSLVTDVTQTSTPSPTTVSSSGTPVVTQSPSAPTVQQTNIGEPLDTPKPVSTPTQQVPLSNNPIPTSTKTPFDLFPVIIGLTAVIFISRRTND